LVRIGRRWIAAHKRRVLAGAVAGVVLVGVAIGFALSGSTPPVGPAPIGTHGYDVSWPQCAGDGATNMPPGRPAYVVLGLTHGAGHTVNPCLGSQLAWAKSRGVRVGAYLVVSYPSQQELAAAGNGLFGACGLSTRCRLRNDGAVQAQVAISTMRAAGFASPIVWMDVELGATLSWSRHTKANVAVLRGVVAGLQAAHLPVGVYTTVSMWDQITGGYRLDVPNWLPSGDGKARHAAKLCRTTATGGATWLVQYTRALDSDLTCPVLDPVPGVHTALWQFRNTTLHVSSTGAAVSAVQKAVGQPVTGTYEASTASAVRTWQADHHVPVTGAIGPADWRAMGALRTVGGHGFWLSRIVSPS
jgi:peptidoglycan hydrolase-like protein with peptidoglycan-binding domain